MAVFYLKLNHHLENSIMTAGELLVIEEQRKTDKKLRKKEEDYKRTFYKFLTERDIKDTGKN